MTSALTSRPSEDLLPSDTAMGPVTLLVRDLDVMTTFYADGVGLSVIAADAQVAELGRGTNVLVRLEYAPELTQPLARSAGLFHAAIVFASPAALAQSLHSVSANYPHLYTGAADHLVSEAFYFSDPEGNGVELYRDRPRDTWNWNNGHVELNNLYLDPTAYLRAHLGAPTTDSTQARPMDATIGHVHLSVGDVASARDFYVDKLGFEVTAAYGSQALFVSAGGYHHHMAMNTWMSAGAGPRNRALGLGQVDIVLPKMDDILALRDRMNFSGVNSTDDGRIVTLLDPWNNQIRVSLGGAS